MLTELYWPLKWSTASKAILILSGVNVGAMGVVMTLPCAAARVNADSDDSLSCYSRHTSTLRRPVIRIDAFMEENRTKAKLCMCLITSERSFDSRGTCTFSNSRIFRILYESYIALNFYHYIGQHPRSPSIHTQNTPMMSSRDDSQPVDDQVPMPPAPPTYCKCPLFIGVDSGTSTL